VNPRGGFVSFGLVKVADGGLREWFAEHSHSRFPSFVADKSQPLDV